MSRSVYLRRMQISEAPGLKIDTQVSEQWYPEASGLTEIKAALVMSQATSISLALLPIPTGRECEFQPD